MSVVANNSLTLRCVAHGPPEPVRIIWLQDGAPLNKLDDAIALSPSTLNLTGTDHFIRIINRQIKSTFTVFSRRPLFKVIYITVKRLSSYGSFKGPTAATWLLVRPLDYQSCILTTRQWKEFSTNTTALTVRLLGINTGTCDVTSII